jgi:hypothetical protein
VLVAINTQSNLRERREKQRRKEFDFGVFFGMLFIGFEGNTIYFVLRRLLGETSSASRKAEKLPKPCERLYPD